MSHLVAAYVYVAGWETAPRPPSRTVSRKVKVPSLPYISGEHIRDPTVYTFSVDGLIVQPALLLNRSLDFCRCAARASWHAFWRSTTPLPEALGAFPVSEEQQRTAQKTSSCTPHCTGTCDMSLAPAATCLPQIPPAREYLQRGQVSHLLSS